MNIPAFIQRLRPGRRFELRVRFGLAVAVIGVALTLSAATVVQAQSTINSLTTEEIHGGWRLLFDGRTLNGWRGYRSEETTGWEVVDGAITRVGRGGDIITRETFGDFELVLDWKIDQGGNSGVLYRAALGLAEIYHGAPEMQVLDDERHADGRSPLTSSGSNYGLHAAPRGIVKPAGEWNNSKIVAIGNHVEHWLNGQKIVEYELHSDEWKKLVADSKFAQWPEYGMASVGHIGLQDHGSRVQFRNIKVRLRGEQGTTAGGGAGGGREVGGGVGVGFKGTVKGIGMECCRGTRGPGTGGGCSWRSPPGSPSASYWPSALGRPDTEDPSPSGCTSPRFPGSPWTAPGGGPS